MNIKNQEKPVMRNIHLPCHGFFFYHKGITFLNGDNAERSISARKGAEKYYCIIK